MQAKLTFPGQGTFRTQSQRRFVMVRWSLHTDRAVIVRRSDTLATLQREQRKHDSSVRIFDTTTGQVVA